MMICERYKFTNQLCLVLNNSRRLARDCLRRPLCALIRAVFEREPITITVSIIIIIIIRPNGVAAASLNMVARGRLKAP
jgi:hypothetical protein